MGSNLCRCDKARKIVSPAGNERFCEMAALTPQTILWEIERLSPAGTFVEAATSQSRQHVGCKAGGQCGVKSEVPRETPDL
jgi:hypothetical protein